MASEDDGRHFISVTKCYLLSCTWRSVMASEDVILSQSLSVTY